MPIKKTALLLVLITSLLIVCCRPDKQPIPDTPEPIDDSSVVVDMSKVPYKKLSDYRFFKGDLKNQQPNENVLPFKPASALFTDYALKKRFVWMPKGQTAKYVADDKILDMPTGSVLIKNFYYDHVQPNNTIRIIETRVMIKKDEGWIFAEYVWNDAQDEAYLDMEGSNTDITWENENGIMLNDTYRIPSSVECHTCHKSNETSLPIGIKPQNLNNDFTYNDGAFNQLQQWINTGYLDNSNLPSSIVSTIDYSDASQPLELRVRSYLDINCAHCHSENGHCDYRSLRLAFSESTNPDNMGICVMPDENINDTLKYIISPQKTSASMLFYRISSTDPAVRMPLLGRNIVHQEAVEMIKEWINNLPPCN